MHANSYYQSALHPRRRRGDGILEKKKGKRPYKYHRHFPPPQKNNARNHNEKFNIPTAMFTG
jgi:hypothetical protein